MSECAVSSNQVHPSGVPAGGAGPQWSVCVNGWSSVVKLGVNLELGILDSHLVLMRAKATARVSIEPPAVGTAMFVKTRLLDDPVG